MFITYHFNFKAFIYIDIILLSNNDYIIKNVLHFIIVGQ